MRIRHRTLALVVIALVACSKEPTPPAASTATAPATPPAQPAPATPAPAAPAPAPKETVFSQAELDQMVAPIALYPDSLLAQVLMAATYPGNVADAVAWSKANPKATGDDAVRQVASQPWDPSVQSLVAFPQVMSTLGQDPAWVQRLGDAFLAQPDDVMDAVQRLRRQAQSAGNLASNEYQKVTTQPAAAPPPAAAPASGGTVEEVQTASSPTIIIEPTNPQTVYVPSYNPTTVYGTWAYPSYPPPYYPPSPYYYPGSALMAGLAFGTGVAITNALWGDCDWGGGDIDIDVNRYNNINSNRSFEGSRNTWQHNSANRQGVPYRDNASRERYGRQLDNGGRRDAFRGDDPGRADARANARKSMEQRGIERPGSENRSARDRAQTASRDVRDNQARDQARNRAQASTDRAQMQDRQRSQAAQGARDRQQAQDRQRAQAGQRDRAQAQDRQRAQGQQHRQNQSNAQARDAARRQQSQRQGPSNNAFAGAHSPSQSRAQADRGRASHASASRPQASRGGGGGHQVARSSNPPQRQGGGARRR